MGLAKGRWSCGATMVLLVGGIFSPADVIQGQQPRERLIPGPLEAYAASIFSGDVSSTEGGFTLLLPTGARAVSLGRAVTASLGSESAFWNPAGLSQIEEDRFVVLRGNNPAGEATAFSLILAKQPIGVFAVSYQLLDVGEVELTDKDGNTIGSVNWRDHLGIVSFATQLLPGLDGGINFKIFQTRATCRGQCTAGATGTTYLMDIGVQSVPLQSIPLRIGAMVAHAGPNLQIINADQADPLPTRLRVAASYELLTHFLDRPDMELWATVEVEDRLRELGSPVLYVGTEFLAGQGDQIFVRAGYGQGQPGLPAGAAVGLGLKYQQFEIAIAKSLSGSLSAETDPVHVTFGVLF